MSCPAESHKLEEFEKKKYESSDTTGYRPKGGYQPNGVKIIKAVRLYSQKEDNKTKMKLEELLGQALIEDQLIDSALGNKCRCEGVDVKKVDRESYIGWGGQPVSGSCCSCDKVKCSCDSKCDCDSKCKCEDDCRHHGSNCGAEEGY